MQLNQKFFPLEGNFPDFRPRERVDPGDALKDSKSHVGHRQIEGNSLVVLGRMHLHAVQLAPTCGLQKVQVSFSRRLSSESREMSLRTAESPWAASILPVFLVVFHDSPLHRMVLLRHKSIWRQVIVVGVVFVRVIAARCWKGCFCLEKKFFSRCELSRDYLVRYNSPLVLLCYRCIEGYRLLDLFWFVSRKDSECIPPPAVPGRVRRIWHRTWASGRWARAPPAGWGPSPGRASTWFR